MYLVEDILLLGSSNLSNNKRPNSYVCASILSLEQRDESVITVTGNHILFVTMISNCVAL